jgi:hypothetical protein
MIAMIQVRITIFFMMLFLDSLFQRGTRNRDLHILLPYFLPQSPWGVLHRYIPSIYCIWFDNFWGLHNTENDGTIHAELNLEGYRFYYEYSHRFLLCCC